jgi:MYXO-CTERM domain-containing protein
VKSSNRKDLPPKGREWGQRNKTCPSLILADLGRVRILIVNTRLMLINRILTTSKFGSRIAINSLYVPKRGLLKKLFLLACLIVLAAPFSASAQHRHHIRADEMAGMGVGAAALVGVAGYFLLRRRHSS